MLNPHLVQVLAVSGFFVPQFGQNKSASEDMANPAGIQSCLPTLHATPVCSQALRDARSERRRATSFGFCGPPAAEQWSRFCGPPGALTPRGGAH